MVRGKKYIAGRSAKQLGLCGSGVPNGPRPNPDLRVFLSESFYRSTVGRPISVAQGYTPILTIARYGLAGRDFLQKRT